MNREPDRVSAKADLRVARRRDIGVAVPDHGDDPRHRDDDPVTREGGDLLVEPPDGGFELLARHRVEQIPVALRHLLGQGAQVLAPSRGFGSVAETAAGGVSCARAVRQTGRMPDSKTTTT